MKLSSKLILSIILLVALAFSVGGTLMVTQNFKTALEDNINQNTSKHMLTRYNLESKILSDQLKGEAFSTGAVARYADQISSFAGGDNL